MLVHQPHNLVDVGAEEHGCAVACDVFEELKRVVELHHKTGNLGFLVFMGYQLVVLVGSNHDFVVGSGVNQLFGFTHLHRGVKEATLLARRDFPAIVLPHDDDVSLVDEVVVGVRWDAS